MDIVDTVDKACRVPDVFDVNPTKCANPRCRRFDEAYCNGSFYRENGNLDLSALPRFPADQKLSSVYGVSRTYGGGKSGAHLFGICRGPCPCSTCGDAKKCSKEDQAKEQRYMLKVYPSAFDRNDHVADLGPFTEIYTQCMMSGHQGYTCMVCYGIAEWSSVEDLFTRKLSDISKKCHGDMVGIPKERIPKRVLFQVTTVAPGTPLLASSLIDHPSKLLGCMLQIMAVWQTARNRMGRDVFAHWDFHPDNIFVDWGCAARPPLEVPALDTLMRQTRALFKKVAFYGRFSDRANWTQTITMAFDKATSLTLDSIAEVLVQRKTGLKVHIHGAAGMARAKTTLKRALADTRRTIATMTELGPMRPYVLGVVDQVMLWMSMDTFVKIEYPSVTVIDFDLVTSTKFPEKRPKHVDKSSSAVPVTERALAFVLTWLPANRTMQWINVLSVAIKASKISLDYAHIITYIYVFVVYHLHLNVMPDTSVNNICGLVAKAWAGAMDEVVRLASSLDVRSLVAMTQRLMTNVTTTLTPGLSVVTNHTVTAFGASLGLKHMGAMGIVDPIVTHGRDILHAALTGEFKPSALANKGMQMLFGSGQTSPVQFMRAMQANLQHMTAMYYQLTRQFPSQDTLFVTVFRIPTPMADVTTKGLDKFINLAGDQQRLRQHATVQTLFNTIKAAARSNHVCNLRCTLRYPKNVWLGLFDHMFGEVVAPRQPGWEYAFLYGFRNVDRPYVPDVNVAERDAVRQYLEAFFGSGWWGWAASWFVSSDTIADIAVDLMTRRIVLHASFPDAKPREIDDARSDPARITMSIDGGSTIMIRSHIDLYLTIGLDRETDVCDFAGQDNQVALCVDNHEPKWSDTALLVKLGFNEVVVELYPNGSMALKIVVDLPDAQGVSERSGIHHVVRWTLNIMAIVQVVSGLGRRLGLLSAGTASTVDMLRTIIRTIAVKHIVMDVAKLGEYVQPMVVKALDLDTDSVLVTTEGTRLVLRALIPKGDPLHCIGALSSLVAGDPNLASILDCASFLSPASGFSVMGYVKDLFLGLMPMATPNSELSVDLFLGDVGAGVGVATPIKNVPEPLPKHAHKTYVRNTDLVIHQPMVRTRYNPLTNQYPLQLIAPSKQVWGVHAASVVLSAINAGIESSEKFSEYVNRIDRPDAMPYWLLLYYDRVLDEVRAQNGHLHDLKVAVARSERVLHTYGELADAAQTRASADLRLVIEKAKEEMHEHHISVVAGVLDSVADVDVNQGGWLVQNAANHVRDVMS